MKYYAVFCYPGKLHLRFEVELSVWERALSLYERCLLSSLLIVGTLRIMS